MSIEVKTIHSDDISAWDAYVHTHPRATLYHLSGWKNVIEKTYGHNTCYLMAFKTAKSNPTNPLNPSNPIAGILPLVHLRHFLFGNSLISIPFFDTGGILADDEETERKLLSRAKEQALGLGVERIELRQTHPLSSLNPTNPTNPITTATKSQKVRMLLPLPESSDILMKSFKSKLRSQIKRPLKEGLSSKIGGLELLDDFYRVFLVNMRDLGSPVHSKSLLRNVFEEFHERVKIVMVYRDAQPMACSLVIGFKDILENPWASSLRKYSLFSPNMLLYWVMLEYACKKGFKCFDFGRSSPGEGSCKFKEQWGAVPEPLHWSYISLHGKPTVDEAEPDNQKKFNKAIKYWQKLPVPVTKVIGPRIRKHIGL